MTKKEAVHAGKRLKVFDTLVPSQALRITGAGCAE